MEVSRFVPKCISVTGDEAMEVEISHLHVLCFMLSKETSSMTSNSNNKLLITSNKTVLLPEPTQNTVKIQTFFSHNTNLILLI